MGRFSLHANCLTTDIMILSSQLLSYNAYIQNKIISNRVRADYLCPTLNILSYPQSYSYIILILLSVIIPLLGSFYRTESEQSSGSVTILYLSRVMEGF